MIGKQLTLVPPGETHRIYGRRDARRYNFRNEFPVYPPAFGLAFSGVKS